MTKSAEYPNGAWPAGIALVLTLLLAAPSAWAESWRGRDLQAIIEELRGNGLPVLYSSGLVHPGMPVAEEPAGVTPAARLGQALQPFGLDIRAGPYGSILIVRAQSPPLPVPAATPAAVPMAPEIVVTTSRYEMAREPVMPMVTLTNTDVERLPDLGDDPLRAVARLPGTAMNGLSSRTNIRGGAADETLVTFDDLRLFNPFHLKDFQSIFSAIDPAVIERLNVYTGAFPASYGDRLSGVIDIDAFEPPGDSYRAVALSLFNVSGLVSDDWSDGRGTWLASARRGNLDLMLDLAGQDNGEPRYSDLHGQVAWAFSRQLRVSANALVFDDDIQVYSSDQEERATADYHDSYLWLRADARLTEKLDGFTLLSYADLTVRREGIAAQPGISSGTLQDRRSHEIIGLATRWSLAVDGGHRVDFGGELRHSQGRYFYMDDVTFDVLFDTPGAPTEASRARNISLSPEGEYYAGYLSARVNLPGDWTSELGVLWDRSTLAGGSGHLSPRLSLLYQLTDTTGLRASWGRYWQSQGIDELAVSDGEIAFADPERADQLVLGIEQQLGPGTTLRLEFYAKHYEDPRDRYENLLDSFILLPELRPDRIRVSADEANARGVELSVHSGNADGLDWWGSYSWSTVRDEYNGLKFPRSWDQSHAVSAGLLWSSDRWDLSAAATYRTGWPTTQVALENETLPGIVAAGQRNAERLDSYATVDLRAARRFPTSAGLVTAFIEITNSLNRRNYCCVEYGIAVDEDGALQLERKRNLPILPSVGVSWQF